MAVGSYIVLNQFIVGSIMVRHMNSILVLSLPLRVYCLMRCTHNALWGVIMNSFDRTWSYVTLVFGKICKIWHYWIVCAYLFSTSQILLSLWDLSGLGAEGSSGTNWLLCHVEVLGWLSFIFNSTILSSISWKCKSFFGVFACFYHRS